MRIITEKERPTISSTTNWKMLEQVLSFSYLGREIPDGGRSETEV